MKFSALLLLASMPVYAQAQHPGDITGQVFIVLQSGAAVKLALADVVVVTTEQVQNMATESNRIKRTMYAEAAKQVAAIDPNIDKALNEKITAARIHTTNAEKKLNAAKASGSSQQIKIAEFNLKEEAKIFETLKESLTMEAIQAGDRSRQSALNRRDEIVSASRFVIDELPYAKTRSDADGDLSIKRVSGGAILISVKRLNEYLRWFLWIDSLPAEKISFSNHNLYGVEPEGQVLIPERTSFEKN